MKRAVLRIAGAGLLTLLGSGVFVALILASWHAGYNRMLF